MDSDSVRTQASLQCSDCPRVFPRPCDLNRHRQKHLKRFPCGVCSHRFTLKTGLQRHERTHDVGRVKFDCLWPGCRFCGTARPDTLLKHMKRAHCTTSESEIREVYRLYSLSTEKTKPMVKERHDKAPLAFFQSIISADQETIGRLIREGHDINQQDDQGSTMLHCALRNGHVSVAETLLRQPGLQAWREDKERYTPLSIAISRGHHGIAVLLLSRSDISLGTSTMQLVTLAADKGWSDIMEQLLNYYNSSLKEGSAVPRARSATVTLPSGCSQDTESLPKNEPASQVKTILQKVLKLACKKGYVDVARLSLDRGADVGLHDRFAQTPLHYASKHGHEAVVQHLLDKGADLESRDKWGNTPLHYASRDGYEAVVQHLLDRGADVGSRGCRARTPLHYASKHGHEAVIHHLLDTGANIEATNYSDATPLHLALEEGLLSTVALLLERGANPNGCESCKPIHGAADAGNESVVALLLAHGAQIDATDYSDRTALGLASYRGHEAVVRLLLAHGSDVNPPEGASGYWDPPLSEASFYGYSSIVELLLGHGAKIDRIGHGGTALHRAAEGGHKVVVDVLLKSGADVNISSEFQGPVWRSEYSYGTAADAAASFGHHDIAEILRARCAVRMGASQPGRLENEQ